MEPNLGNLGQRTRETLELELRNVLATDLAQSEALDAKRGLGLDRESHSGVMMVGSLNLQRKAMSDLGSCLDELAAIVHPDAWAPPEIMRPAKGDDTDNDILILNSIGRRKYIVVIGFSFVGSFAVAMAIAPQWASFIFKFTQQYSSLAVTLQAP